MDIEGILAILLIFGGGALIAISFSPLGRAVADRIRGKAAAPEAGELRAELAEHKEALDQELETVRHELAELAERLDFAERLLAKQQRDGERLVPPRS
jgi:hypothetical protein